MKLPKKLRIGFRDWKVRLTQAIASDLYGLCDPVGGTLTILKGQSKDQELNTVIHEITHVMFREGGIDVDNDLEERIVTVLSNQWVDALRRNPKLREYIMHRLEELSERESE